MYLNLHAYSGLTPCGSSRFDFFEAFQSRKKPNIEMQKFAQCEQEILVYKIPHYNLNIDLPVAVLRRMGFFTKHMLHCAIETLGQRSISKNMGLIVGSAYGPSSKVDQYISKVVEHGELGASPIHFSTSIFNAATSFVAQTLHIIGPTCTIANANFSLNNALLLAAQWIEKFDLEYVLVLAGDEMFHMNAISFYLKNKICPPEQYNPLSIDCAIAGESFIGLLVSKHQPESNNIIKLKIDPHLKTSHLHQGFIDAQGGLYDTDIYSAFKNMYTTGKFIGSTPSVATADLLLALESIEKNESERQILYQINWDHRICKVEVFRDKLN